MRIKHWQGYGTLEAKRISTKTKIDPFYGDTKTVHIRVKGNHEWGLERNDKYDVFNWLLKKFDRTANDYRQITDLNLVSSTEDGIDVCDYYITYRLDS